MQTLVPLVKSDQKVAGKEQGAGWENRMRLRGSRSSFKKGSGFSEGGLGDDSEKGVAWPWSGEDKTA